MLKRYLVFYLILTTLIILLDTYTYQGIKAAFRDFSSNHKTLISVLYWSVTVLFIAALTSGFFFSVDKWPRTLRSYVFSVIMLIILAKLIVVAALFVEDITRFISWLFQKVSNNSAEGSESLAIPRSKFLGQIALIVGGIPLAIGLHGILRNPYNYKIHRVKVPLPHLPDSFNGLKIVQISDVHSGSFSSKPSVMKGIDLINKEDADLVFFTGDIVNYKYDEMYPFVDIFSKISAKEGVFSIFGNHDYADYVRYESQQEAVKGKQENREKLIAIHRSMGWDVLMNENRILQRGNDTLAIIGSENWSARGFSTYGDLEKAYRGCENADVKLLLSHDPTHWDTEVTKKYQDIDVTFSGHTHGAQLGIEVPGWIKWSPAQFIYKHWAGLYQEGRQFLYVNRGFGFIGFHGRIGILPEITVMELTKA